MTTIRQILTHPGGAHKDEFLACSVLLALHPVPILRREPTADDLADPETCVLDVGHEHAPAKSNFDHHQLPRDHLPTCSLSLVLQHLELYDDARRFCDWLEPAEWFDCRGPHSTAKWLGIPREVVNQLNSPIDITLLRRFAQAEILQPGEPLWEIMRMVGEDLLDYVKTLQARLDFLSRTAEFWTLDAPEGAFQVVYVPRTDPLPDEPSMGLEAFIESQGRSGDVVAMVYPDRRGSGYGLSRFQDHLRLDFTRIATAPDVHFTHARGFIAKTSATDGQALKDLLLLAAGANTTS